MIEPPGDNCEFGGLKIETGLDLNRNGVLDPNEVQDTAFVCNGENGEEEGFNTLTNTMIEPPGANCDFGGLKIETGLDLNRNGVLDPNEVQDTAFVCNGEPGGGSTCSLSLAGAGTTSGSLMGLILYALIPAVIVVRRRFRRK